jgi:hypothetical protein
MLGDAFSGIVSCDFYSAYKKLESQTAAKLQLCWAHLIREIKYVAEKPDKRTAKWGVNLLDAVQEMFHLILRKDELLLQNWLRKMFAIKENILQLSNYYGHDNDVCKLSNRLRDWSAEYF